MVRALPLLLIIACTSSPTKSPVSTPTTTPTTTTPTDPCLGGEQLGLCFEALPGVTMTIDTLWQYLGRTLDTRDLDGDGILELLVTASGDFEMPSAYVVRDPEDGPIADQAIATSTGVGGHARLVGDLTGDGIVDLIHYDYGFGLVEVVAGPLEGALGPDDVVATWLLAAAHRAAVPRRVGGPRRGSRGV